MAAPSPTSARACELHHELAGPTGAPVVVLGPSLGTDLSIWEPQAKKLADRFRVLRYDLRGHGSSPVPAGPYSIADLGADLLALLDRLEIERAALCGISIGGMASMWAAAHAPARVTGLVVCCSSALLDPERSYHARAETVLERGIEETADAVLARWFTPGFAEANHAVVERMRRILIATPPQGYAGCCEALAGLDLRAELALIDAPTLVLSASEDLATPPEHGRLIAERIRTARMEVVPDAAHLANVEQPELVGELILGHLDPTEEERE